MMETIYMGANLDMIDHICIKSVTKHPRGEFVEHAKTVPRGRWLLHNGYNCTVERMLLSTTFANIVVGNR